MKTLSFEELYIDLAKMAKKEWGYDDLSESEKRALLDKKEYANFPQPVDYGLTRDDLKFDWHLVSYRDARNELRFKEEERRGRFGRFIAGFFQNPHPTLASCHLRKRCDFTSCIRLLSKRPHGNNRS
jgi:hypothetical protein